LHHHPDAVTIRDGNSPKGARIMANEEEPGITVSVQVIELSAMHMPYVLANVIGKVLSSVPSDQRQAVFYALASTAHASVDNVKGAADEDITRHAQMATRIYVENSLSTVADQMGLKTPENDRGGPIAH
jgi:hypothetical protein